MADPAIDKAIATSASKTELVDKLQVVAPDLAAALVGKALIASKSPWGTIAGTVIGYVVAKYVLGWDENTQQVLAGAVVLAFTAAAAYIMRYFTSAPIVAIVAKPAT